MRLGINGTLQRQRAVEVFPEQLAT